MYVQAVIDSCLFKCLFKIIKYVSVKYKPSKKYFRSLFIFSYFICETKSFTRVFYFLNWIFLNRRHFFSIRKIQKISFSDMNICKTGKCELNDIIKKMVRQQFRINQSWSMGFRQRNWWWWCCHKWVHRCYFRFRPWWWTRRL